MDKNLQLCLTEGWELTKNSTILVNGREYPISHPYQIYLAIYRDSTIPLEKLHAMQKVHDFLWPHLILTNNYWKERMFKAHCSGKRIVVLASGGGIGKSDCCACIAIIYWLAHPRKRAVVISSTTLESLEKRIWGYVVKRMNEIVLPVPFECKKSKPPKFVYPNQEDELTGIFTAAIREGDDERTLSTAVGKHPEDGLLVFLDESTDISPNIIDAIPNWEQGTPNFQLFALGNSKSTHDLHGSLAKPLHGWDSVTPNVFEWETCQKEGICLYFNPHDSPAIHEKDPVKKVALSRFLITEDKLKEKKKQYGEHSDAYYRQVLGFWKQSSIDEVVITDLRIKESSPYQSAEFSGLYPIKIVAGLDAAIDDNLKGCVLRFGILGHTTSGLFVLDYRSDKLLHYIDTAPTLNKSQELQLADNVITLLNKFNCPLSNLAIDATGLGRPLGELIRQRLQTREEPIKIVTRRGFGGKSEKDHGLVTISTLELVESLSAFIQHGQIRGLDDITAEQLYSRLIIEKGGKRTLEPKESFKKRMTASNPSLARSPDELDAATLTLQAAILRQNFTLGQSIAVTENDMFYNQKYKTYLIEKNAIKTQQTASHKPPKLSPVAKFSNSVENSVTPSTLQWIKN